MPDWITGSVVFKAITWILDKAHNLAGLQSKKTISRIKNTHEGTVKLTEISINFDDS